MPLLDHFRPPVSNEIQWNTFHSAWASFIANSLNDVVPAEFRVYENLKIGGGVEIDIATTRRSRGATARPPLSPRTGSPRARCRCRLPSRIGSRCSCEVLVFRQFGGRQLVGAIELVSPGNKDRDEAREAFAMKVASYLHEGVSVLVVDAVAERRANLHDEIARMMRWPDDMRMPPDPPLYAASFRPAFRDDRPEIDIWVNQFSVGDPLPTMPLRLIADYFVPVELEATYTEVCRRRRLIA